jgi:hypothetical protein
MDSCDRGECGAPVAAGGAQCLAHLPTDDRDFALRSLRDHHDEVDLEDAAITGRELSAVIEEITDEDGVIRSELLLRDALIDGSVRVNGCTFGEAVIFEGCRISGSLRLTNVSGLAG